MIYVLSILFALVFVAATVFTVRRGRFHLPYAILWLILALLILLVSLSIPIWNRIAHLLGVEYPPALLFLCAILFCLVYIFRLTVTISKLIDKNTRLTQEIGIIKQQLREMRRQQHD